MMMKKFMVLLDQSRTVSGRVKSFESGMVGLDPAHNKVARYATRQSMLVAESIALKLAFDKVQQSGNDSRLQV